MPLNKARFNTKEKGGHNLSIQGGPCPEGRWASLHTHTGEGKDTLLLIPMAVPFPFGYVGKMAENPTGSDS